jgi:hypothetical protein
MGSRLAGMENFEEEIGGTVTDCGRESNRGNLNFMKNICDWLLSF